MYMLILLSPVILFVVAIVLVLAGEYVKALIVMVIAIAIAQVLLRFMGESIKIQENVKSDNKKKK